MPEGSVRDLWVNVAMDTTKFTSSSVTLKSELNSLKAELKTLESGKSVEDATAAIEANLEAQMEVVGKQIENYQQRVDKLAQDMDAAVDNPAKATALAKELGSAATALENSKQYLNDLEEKMKTFDATNFSSMMQELSGFLMDLDNSYNRLIGDWAKESTDNAYDIAVSREQAYKEMFKVADGATEEWLDNTIDRVERVIRVVPTSFEHMMEIMADAMQAGGLPYQDALAFAESFAKLESAAPKLLGSEGVAEFAKYLNLMDVAPGEYEKVASALVDLGNHYAAFEDQILDTAKRSASAMQAMGLDAADGLAIATSALSLGMEPEAAASSIERLFQKLGTGAEMATGKYLEFLEVANAGGFESIYDMRIEMDRESAYAKGLMGEMGMTSDDLYRTVNALALAEKYAQVLNMTVEEFGAFYEADPAQAFVDFFDAIGRMDETQADGLMHTLNMLGISEIRVSRLARNFVSNADTLQSALDTSREAYAEGEALEREFAAMAGAESSQIILRKNAAENAAAALGNTVVAMRKPFDDFFASVKQGFADMPDWVHAAAGGIMEVLGGIGSVIGTVGDLSQGMYYTGEMIKKFQGIEWGALGGKLKTVGKYAVPATAAAGLVALISTISTMAADTTAISQALANIQINIDENSKDATLAAIAEVKRAAESLSKPELDEKYAGTSAIVKQGWGTLDMFGQALGYEQAVFEQDIEAIYDDFGLELRRLQEQLLAATTDGEREILQAQIEETETLMKEVVAEAKDTYAQSINDLVNGAIKQQDGAAELLSRISRRYDYMQLIYQAQGIYDQNARRAFFRENQDALTALREEFGVSYVDRFSQLDTATAIKALYDQMEDDVAALVSDGDMMSILSTLVSGGMLEGMDLSQVEGSMQQMMRALDIYQIATQGAKDWREIGKYSMTGISSGIKDGNGNVLSTVTETGQGMLDAMRSILQIQSPSQAFAEIGGYAIAGLAQGILDSQGSAVAAIRAVGAAMQAEAAAQAARVSAILSMAGYGGGGVAAGTGYGGTAGAGAVTQNFNITAGSLAEQQSVIWLAQKLERIDVRTNRGVGNFR